MSNIPENKKPTGEEEVGTRQPLPEDETPTAKTDDEFSTIFSDPVEHRKIAPDKRKKYFLRALAGVLAVAVLGAGTWAVIEFIPERKDENAVASIGEDATTAIKETLSDDIKTLTVINELGTIEFYSTTEEVEDEAADGTSSTTQVNTWYIKGVDKSYISTSSVGNFVGQFGTIDSVREITGMSLADCGLDKPIVTATAVLKDSTEYTLTVGDVADSLTGAYYGKLSDSDKIFLLESGYVDELATVQALDFDATVATPTYEAPDGADEYLADDGTLAFFDKLYVSSKNFSETLVFESNSNEELANMLGYVVTSPSMRIAQNAEYVVAIFKNGLSVDGAYSFDVSERSLKKFGLDAPDFVAKLDIMGKTMTYKFKLQDDGYCAVIADGAKVISKVSSTTDLSGGEGTVLLSDILEFGITDFYAYWISLYNIADLDEFNVTVDGKEYSFSIKENTDTESEDSYIIKMNGKQIDCSSFQYLYQYFISMSCSDYSVEDLSGEPEVLIEFKFNKETYSNSTIEFRRSGASRYQYTIDGIDMGKTTSAEMNKFIKFLEKVAAGEIIEEIV